MGLIFDSSVVIAAERRGDTPEQLVHQVISVAGNQEAALSSVGLTELVHGICRANSVERRLRRQSFVEELRIGLTVIPTRWKPQCWLGRLTANRRPWASIFHLSIC